MAGPDDADGAIVQLCDTSRGAEPNLIVALVDALNEPGSYALVEIDDKLYLRPVRPRRAARVPPFSPDARARAAA
jgi:hypothetical protein